MVLCFNASFSPALKHTHPVQNRLSAMAPCFNATISPPLKHTHPLQNHLRALAPCFNAPRLASEAPLWR